MYRLLSNKRPRGLDIFQKGLLLEVNFQYKNSQKIQIFENFDAKSWIWFLIGLAIKFIIRIISAD